MNVQDVLRYGHAEVERAVDAFPADRWDEPGVTGVWSGKDLIGHLGAFEQVLVDVLRTLAAETREGVTAKDTPHLDAMRAGDFNDTQAAHRADWSLDEVLDEYRGAYEAAMEAVEGLDAEFMRRPGTMPWYGPEYSFDDLVVYQYYGHKREHVSQLAAFTSRSEP